MMLDLLSRLERLAGKCDRVAAAPVLVELHELLDRHDRREEDGVYAQAVSSHLELDGTGRLLEDHDWIHELVLLSVSRAPAALWEVAVRDVVGRLRDQIRREENHLFPVAHQFLSPAQWDAVGVATSCDRRRR